MRNSCLISEIFTTPVRLHLAAETARMRKSPMSDSLSCRIADPPYPPDLHRGIPSVPHRRPRALCVACNLALSTSRDMRQRLPSRNTY